MRKQEKELFKSLCSFKDETFDETLLKAATPAVLGHLFFNRMQGIAYGTLKRHALFDKVSREFRNSIKGAHIQNCEKNSTFFWAVQYVTNLLSKCECKYAMLKGARLCGMYPTGCRTSNDIDLLVRPQDVMVIGEALSKAGFKQGSVRNGKFEPATRREIIESKMMRGETVPYIKEINFPGMRFLEVDINFSLDYKPNNTDLVSEMLANTSVVEFQGLFVRTLREDDFFVHLCCHLYKEATTLPWVEMKRDMTLYKYCDIYMLLNDEEKEKVDAWFARATALGLEKVCAFAVLQTAQLFHLKNEYVISVAENILKSEPEFIHTVISPKEKKAYVFFEKDIEKRFFANNRKNLLGEVESR